MFIYFYIAENLKLPDFMQFSTRRTNIEATEKQIT